jgi:hypothetical protein
MFNKDTVWATGFRVAAVVLTCSLAVWATVPAPRQDGPTNLNFEP